MCWNTGVIGWALGRQVPIIVLLYPGGTLGGFLEQYQAIPINTDSYDRVAGEGRRNVQCGREFRIGYRRLACIPAVWRLHPIHSHLKVTLHNLAQKSESLRHGSRTG